ncbi:MAG TPA: hypothetical protein VGC76_12250 [Pyrinomonadaceae bacterium]|jgi:hypothetical protein
MKKFLAGLVVLFMLLISIPISADAQCRRNSSRNRNYNSRNYNSRNYNNRNYNNRNYNRSYYQTRGYVSQRPNFYQRHRNLINVGIGTGAGTLIGALIGGRRGAGWGALAGAGSSALYTYKINPKKRRYYRR